MELAYNGGDNAQITHHMCTHHVKPPVPRMGYILLSYWQMGTF